MLDRKWGVPLLNSDRFDSARSEWFGCGLKQDQLHHTYVGSRFISGPEPKMPNEASWRPRSQCCRLASGLVVRRHGAEAPGPPDSAERPVYQQHRRISSDQPPHQKRAPAHQYLRIAPTTTPCTLTSSAPKESGAI